MLHFDAHPDLACPLNAPAVACFTPRNPVVQMKNEIDAENDHNDKDDSNGKNLYELLDSTTSGIAEWILPLVLAGNLHTVEWVKPSFSSQFAVGIYHYAVGVVAIGDSTPVSSIHHFLDLPPHAHVKVDLCHPYYLDDDSFSPADQLALKQTLELCVSELPLQDNKTESEMHPTAPWMLDICLDYFCCCNPYIQDIQQVSVEAAQALVDLMMASRFHNIHSTAFVEREDDGQGLVYRQQLTAFQDSLRRTLQQQHSSNDYRVGISNNVMLDFFENPHVGETLLTKLLKSIRYNDNLLSMVLEAIPNWSMPHQSDASNHDPAFSDQRLAESLRLVEDSIQRRFAEYGYRPPFLITIARSSDDGFTPSDKVEFLQEQVLAILDRIFCQAACGDSGVNGRIGSSSHLHIVRDYGEWESSTIEEVS
jgi:hypothetical protein